MAVDETLLLPVDSSSTLFQEYNVFQSNKTHLEFIVANSLKRHALRPKLHAYKRVEQIRR